MCSKCKDLNELFKLKNCKHQFCRKCLYYHVQNNFNCKIKCPLSECQRYMSDPNIREFLSQSDELRYEGLSLSKNYKMCLSNGCNFLYAVVGDDNAIIFQCPDCDQPNCIKCNKRHFPGECGKDNLKSESDRDEEAKRVLQRRKKEKIQEYDNKHDLIPSHIGLECPNCLNFILPKLAVMLRCGCTHCKSCLIESSKLKEYSNQLKCDMCDEEFADIEKKIIRGVDDLEMMSERIVSQLTFHCQGVDCDGCWYIDKQSGFICCEKCKQTNCLSCKDVHKEGECDEFRKTKKYKDMVEMMKKAESSSKIKCYQCKSLLIHGGGCAAMPCKNCNVNTCLFLGTKAGPDGCGCTPKIPCHKDCKYGCIPE